MISSVAESTIEAARIAVQESFGNRLRALYLYGSLAEGRYQPDQSDINLLAVVSDEVTFREVRYALRPLWLRENHNARIAPLVSSQPALERHLKLNPILARHLAEQGVLLAGAERLPRPGPISHTEKLARVAYEAMLASSALAPALLPVRAAERSLINLRRLANRLSVTAHGRDNTAVELIAGVQSHVSQEMQEHGQLHTNDNPISQASPLIRDLQAIYESENRIVLVLPDLAPERITELILSTDWAEVTRRVEGKYHALLLTTAGQLQVILKHETAADYHLHNYVHVWGSDPIDGLIVPEWRVYSHLSRMPSELQLATMPQAYIDADELELPMLVHDFQNILLNMQLRSELYGKFSGRLTKTPPMPLPDRNAPIHDRIAGIYEHLAWWSNYHTSEMEHLLVDSS
jgi:hypothetical protein